MLETIKNLTISDKIQLLSVVVAVLLGIMSVIISVVTLIQNKQIIRISNMANIVVMPLKIYGNAIPRIRIKNFGNSVAEILEIKIAPEHPIVTNTIFKNWTGINIAPQQDITTTFVDLSTEKIFLEEFDVIISYKTLGKTIKSKQHISYKFLDSYFEAEEKSKTIRQAMDNINQSIQGLH